MATRSVPKNTNTRPKPVCSVMPSIKTTVAKMAVNTIESLSITVTTTIGPVAEAWWKERGYGCVWPEDDSEPMKVYELETVN